MTTKAQPKLSFEMEFLAAFCQDYHTPTVFIDFVTMCLCALAMDHATKKCFYESIYQQTIARYRAKGDAIRFPLLYGKLVREMDKRAGSRSGNDVLGEFFQNHINSKEDPKFLASWRNCALMADIYQSNSSYEQTLEYRRIIDPECATGRLLVAGARKLGIHNYYFGIDTNVVCTRIAVINLFLNEVYTGEIMCANALIPEDSFVESYILSYNPMRIFRISKQEESPLWRSLAVRPFKHKIDMDAHLMNEKLNQGKGSELSIF